LFGGCSGFSGSNEDDVPSIRTPTGLDAVADDDDARDPNHFVLAVAPPSTDNPLARRVVVDSRQPCSLSGFVRADGETGRLLARPAQTAQGTHHELWFDGLFEEGEFHFAIHLADQPDRIIGASEFTVPALPLWAPRPQVELVDDAVDRRIWFAAQVNSEWVRPDGRMEQAVIVFDRLGRLRFYHETNLEDQVAGLPLAGIVAFSNQDVMWGEGRTLLAARPNGEEYAMFMVRLDRPYFLAEHHQMYVRDWDATHALVIFSSFGPGLKCDLQTPTDRALGDGVALLDDAGFELWSWSAFDHTDAIPLERMNQDVCRAFHWGPDTYDWTHANAVSPVPGEKAFLLSMRNVLMLAKIAAPSGEVLWRMGPELDFTWLGDDAEADQWFRMQHDQKTLPNGHLLLFDNGNCRYTIDCNRGPWSRGLELEVDEDAMTVKKVWEHRVPFSHAMGSIERLPNGNTVIHSGWQGRFCEVTPAGEELWVGHMRNWDKTPTMRPYPSLWTEAE
jgi:hypothetical protein